MPLLDGRPHNTFWFPSPTCFSCTLVHFDKSLHYYSTVFHFTFSSTKKVSSNECIRGTQQGARCIVLAKRIGAWRDLPDPLTGSMLLSHPAFRSRHTNATATLRNRTQNRPIFAKDSTYGYPNYLPCCLLLNVSYVFCTKLATSLLVVAL